MIDPIHINGTTYNLTVDDVREYILRDINHTEVKEGLLRQVTEARSELRVARQKATAFFQEGFDGNIDDDEITFTKDEINEFLDDIGAEQVSTKWEVTVDVRITITGVEASNATDAEGLVERAVNVDIDSAIVDIDNFDYEITDVSANKE